MTCKANFNATMHVHVHVCEELVRVRIANDIQVYIHVHVCVLLCAETDRDVERRQTTFKKIVWVSCIAIVGLF